MKNSHPNPVPARADARGELEGRTRPREKAARGREASLADSACAVAALTDRVERLRAYCAAHPVGAGLMVRVDSPEQWWHEGESEPLPDALAALCRAPDDSHPAGVLYGARLETPRARALSLIHAEKVLDRVEDDIMALDRSLEFRAVAAAELQAIRESLLETLDGCAIAAGEGRQGR